MPWVPAEPQSRVPHPGGGLSAIRNGAPHERCMRVMRDGRLLAEVVLPPNGRYDLHLDRWYRRVGGNHIRTLDEALRAHAPELVVLPLTPVGDNVVVEYWRE